MQVAVHFAPVRAEPNLLINIFDHGNRRAGRFCDMCVVTDARSQVLGFAAT